MPLERIQMITVKTAIIKQPLIKMPVINRVLACAIKTVCTITTICVITVLSGCSAGTNTLNHKDKTDRIVLTDTDKTDAMQTAEDVLTDMHFKIAKSDRRLGIIRTRPLPAAQWFEMWRNDSFTPADKLEANIQSLQKTAVLKISQENEQTIINCTARTYRLNLPTDPPDSSAAAQALFTSTLPAENTNHRNSKRKMSWNLLGKDTALSAEILRRISNKINKKGRTGEGTR